MMLMDVNKDVNVYLFFFRKRPKCITLTGIFLYVEVGAQL